MLHNLTNNNIDISTSSPPRCNNFETSSTSLIKTPNNNGEVSPNKLVVDE